MASSRFVIATISVSSRYAVLEISEPDAPELASPAWLRAICLNKKFATHIKRALNHKCMTSIAEQEDSGVWRYINREAVYERDFKRIWRFDRTSPGKFFSIYQIVDGAPDSRKLLAITMSQADAEYITTALNHSCKWYENEHRYAWWRVYA